MSSRVPQHVDPEKDYAADHLVSNEIPDWVCLHIAHLDSECGSRDLLREEEEVEGKQAECQLSWQKVAKPDNAEWYAHPERLDGIPRRACKIWV